MSLYDNIERWCAANAITSHLYLKKELMLIGATTVLYYDS
jgi:hypothetical protein